MVHNLLFLLVSFMYQCGEVNQAVLLVIFPDGTRTKGATLYRDDRTQRSQEHCKEKESKVETNANKGRSRGNEVMTDPQGAPTVLQEMIRFMVLPIKKLKRSPHPAQPMTSPAKTLIPRLKQLNLHVHQWTKQL